jgi:hypothetical protein
MIDQTKVTTVESVATYLATNNVFLALMKEIRELSKKKPDAVMSKGKVKIINRVLKDLKEILDAEPEGKFLDMLDDSELPQTSDAVLVMVQFETVLRSFKSKYCQSYKVGPYDSESSWVTPEFLEGYEEYGDY